MTPIIEKTGVTKAPNYPKSKMYFNPKRQERVDHSVYAESLRQEQKQHVVPSFTDPEKAGMFVRETKAHFDAVVCLNLIQTNTGGILSSSLDMRVRIWSQELDLWGSINIETNKPEDSWKFPNQEKVKKIESEVEKVKEILCEIAPTQTRPIIVDNNFDQSGDESENHENKKRIVSFRSRKSQKVEPSIVKRKSPPLNISSLLGGHYNPTENAEKIA